MGIEGDRVADVHREAMERELQQLYAQRPEAKLPVRVQAHQPELVWNTHDAGCR